MYLIDYFKNLMNILLLHCSIKYELVSFATKASKHKLKIAKPIDYSL